MRESGTESGEATPPSAPNGEKAVEPAAAVPAPAPAWPTLGYWVRVAVAVVAIVISVQVVLILQGVLLVLLASLVLALGMQPAIAYIESRGVSRAAALASILVGIGVLVGAGAWVMIPVAIDQVEAIGEALPQLQEELREFGGLGQVVANRIDPSSFLREEDDVGRTVGAAAAAIFNVFTVAVLAPYFAYALPRMRRWVLRLTHRDERPDLLRLLNEASERISGYILGNLTVSVIAGVVSFIGFWFMGVEYALVLALWVAITDLVPIVGAFVGAVPAILVGARQGLGLALTVAGFLTVYQLFENYLVSPRVMTRAIDLGPASVIVAVMVGGTLAGITGALLALPLAAMIKVALDQYVISARLEKVQSDYTSPISQRRRRGAQRILP
jgi:predicted PurR-regulated permease PerM